MHVLNITKTRNFILNSDELLSPVPLLINVPDLRCPERLSEGDRGRGHDTAKPGCHNGRERDFELAQ